MTTFGVLFGISMAIAIGAMSPGPSFVLVSRIAVGQSRLHGLASAIGMGLGGALFAVLALAGLVALLEQVEWLYLVLKCAGGLYLVYLGIAIWRGAREPVSTGASDGSAPLTVPGAIVLGLVTQVSNPKTAVVYASIFAALMPHDPPLSVVLALPPLIFLIEAGWYAVVAVAF
jgi:threonine/homoserine/homoserine lactone efflux protein